MRDRTRIIERALARLAAPHALLAPERAGSGYGVFSNGDRRRRPSCRLTATEARELLASGAITAIADDAFVLTDAGKAKVRRIESTPEDGFQEQHGKIVPRTVVDADGALRRLRGFDAAAAIRRLSMLRDGNGAPFLSPEELAAASRLRADWEVGQIGLVPARIGVRRLWARRRAGRTMHAKAPWRRIAMHAGA